MKQHDFVSSVLQRRFTEDAIAQEMIPIGELSPFDVLNIYHSDYSARMKEALGEFYETVWFILGDDDFFSLCDEYIEKHPSKLRDLNQYGDDFPDFIKNHSVSEEVPYLYEMANFEKKFWKLFHKDVKKVEQIFPEDLSQATCQFSNGVKLLSTKFNILSLWDLRKGKISQDEWDHNVDLEVEKFIVLSRVSDQVLIYDIAPSEYQLLQCLKEGVSVGDALTEVDITSEGVSKVFSFIANGLKDHISFADKS